MFSSLLVLLFIIYDRRTQIYFMMSFIRRFDKVERSLLWCSAFCLSVTHVKAFHFETNAGVAIKLCVCVEPYEQFR